MEIRNYEIKPVYDAFLRHAEPKFISILHSRIAGQNSFIAGYESHWRDLAERLTDNLASAGKLELHLAFKKSVHDWIIDLQKTPAQQDFESEFESFFSELEKEIAKLPETLTIQEQFDYYDLKKAEGLLHFVRMLSANTNQSIRMQGRRWANKIRRLLKKPPVALKNHRKRIVPFQHMARHFLVNEFVAKAIEQIHRISQAKSKSLLLLWNHDDNTDLGFQRNLSDDNPDAESVLLLKNQADNLFSQLKEDNERLLESLRLEIGEICREVFESFDNAFEITDTVSLSASAFHQKKTSGNYRKIIGDFNTAESRWRNSHHTLLDDWAVDVEITKLYYSVFERFSHLKSRIDLFVANEIQECFREIRLFIEDSSSRIRAAKSGKSTTSGVIVAERETTNKQLIDKILTPCIELLSGCFHDDFELLLQALPELISQVSDKRGFIKSKNYEQGIRESDISYISPRDLLGFEALPGFKGKVSGIRDRAENHLENVRHTLLSLGTVCDFNLESAMMLLDKEDGNVRKSVEIAVQGFDRAIGHLENAAKTIDEIQTGLISELRRAVNDFNDSIQKLKNTENLFNLNVKIARIRTIEKSKRIRNEFFHLLRILPPKILKWLKEAFSFSVGNINKIKKRLGFAVRKQTVTFELSEFILETQSSLNKLPFVYQRLYQLKPTDEERFFVNRQGELQLLHESYENWKKNRFITTAVIGEKGSGVTSLINFFLQGISSESEIVRYTLGEKLYKQEDYFRFFSSLPDVKEVSTNHDLINQLNQTPGAKIIVIENLQHMFLKKVHGFESLELLFELMSNTSKKIMWIGAFTPHSWEYLEKSVCISNYFTNEIRLEKLSDDIIRGIIYKRNRLSGYKIGFIPDQEIAASKAFVKLSETAKQNYLQKIFFTNLNRLANGNISLAQMYWLRSTQKVDERTIHIAAIGGLDFSFIKSLSSDSLFALQVLLLHDGLKLQDFAVVMNQPESVSRNLLIPMLEKGLLIRPREKFNINPMIFKYVASYLSSKNFIH